MEAIESLTEQLGAADQTAAYKAYQSMLRMVTVLPGNDPGQRGEIAAILAAQLNATVPGGKDKEGKERPPKIRYSTEVRNRLLELLAYVPVAKEVPAIAEAMKDLELRESARQALARNDTTEATQALVTALKQQSGPEFRVGVVNALAGRSDQEAVKALREAIGDVELPVRIAAAEALALQPDPANDALIVKLTNADCSECRCRAYKARVRLASTLVQAGNTSAARTIYKDIARGDAGAAQKKAAEIGLKALG